jgi:hypothetical protein
VQLMAVLVSNTTYCAMSVFFHRGQVYRSLSNRWVLVTEVFSLPMEATSIPFVRIKWRDIRCCTFSSHEINIIGTVLG